MTSNLDALSLLLWTLWTLMAVVAVVQGDFVEPPPTFSMRSLAEAETKLPCRFQVTTDQVVVQVSWIREKADGTKEQILAAHRTDGQTAYGQWSGRVRFGSNEPTVDSSMIIMTTEESDEGKYTCRISTFPSGNFDRQLSLTVWTKPISSLDPVVLVEGQSFQVAASCRSVAHPPPRLSWDTELTGQTHNRSSEGGATSSHFSLHPLRSMNGKKLDCLVWHPALERPRRITNSLVVHFPPDAEVTGYDQNWFAGLEGAALRCVSKGNPKPQSFTWTRKGGVLPEGVTEGNGTLLFDRPLSLTDAGIYQCVAKNDVGAGDAEVEITVTESPQKEPTFDSLLLIIVGAVAGGLLILMLIIVLTVTRHQKHKNKKLKRELTVKKEEITTLSRQASFRIINSVSSCTDARLQTEESIPLRVEGTLRTSLSSLGEQARCRDSRSTLSGGRGGGGGGGLDYLGRPVLYNNSRRGRALERDEENRLRVESYVRNSTMSLETRLHPPLQPSPYPMEQSSEHVRILNGSAIIPTEGGGGFRQGTINRNQQHSPLSCSYPPVTDDDEEDEGVVGDRGGMRSPVDPGQEDDRDSETNSSQISDALNNHYHQNNGTLGRAPRSNAILHTPHTSLIHKAQIV